MKKMAIFLMFITVSLYGQTWIRSYQWNDLCPGPYTSGSAEAWNVIPAIGGGYLLQGHVEFSYGDIPAYEGNAFWLIDEAGNIVWRRANDMVFDAYNSIVTNGVDRYYCLCSHQGSSFLDIYDAEMSFLNHYWFQQVNGYDLQLNDMQFVDDGLVFAGQRNGQGVILKTDFAFNVVWQSNGFYTYSYGFESIEPYNDGWVASSPRCFANFSAVGDTLWTYIDTITQSGYYDCLVTDSNRVYMLGINNPLHYYLFEVDINNQAVAIISDGLSPGGLNERKSLKESANGEIVVLCLASNNNILHSYNQTGTRLWSQSYFTHPYMYFGKGSKNLLTTITGNIIFCIWDDQGQILLLKTDSTGIIVDNNDPVQVPQHANVSHYPNPTNTNVKFTYHTDLVKGRLLIELFNIRGQKLFSKTLSEMSGTIELDLGEIYSPILPNGIYIYRLTNGSKTLASHKMTIMN